MADESAPQAPAQPRGKSPLIPTNLESLYKLADLLSQAGACPSSIRGKPADVFLVLLKGSELGIGMASALANIHIIEGKAVLSADLMVGVAFSHDIVEIWDVVEWTDKVCTIRAKRRGAAFKPITVTWTVAMAEQMGLYAKKGVGGGPPMWAKVPKQMLWARTSGEAARRLAPDYLSGCYAQEEMEDQATAREAKDITPRTVAPPNPARDSRLSIVTRAPLPTLEQKVTPAADTSVKEPAVVEVSHDQEPDHDPATGEVAMEAEPDAFSSDEQTQDSAEAAPDDGTPEVLRSLRINVAAKNPFTREALREAIRSINLIKDEPLKLEAKRLYNEASKLVAA